MLDFYLLGHPLNARIGYLQDASLLVVVSLADNYTNASQQQLWFRNAIPLEASAGPRYLPLSDAPLCCIP